MRKNSTILSVCRCISEKYDFWRVNMSSCKCSDRLLVAGEHMLGLEECYKCPASFTHKHSLQSSHLHNCKHKELPLKPNSEKSYLCQKGQSGWNWAQINLDLFCRHLVPQKNVFIKTACHQWDRWLAIELLKWLAMNYSWPVFVIRKMSLITTFTKSYLNYTVHTVTCYSTEWVELQ